MTALDVADVVAELHAGDLVTAVYEDVTGPHEVTGPVRESPAIPGQLMVGRDTVRLSTVPDLDGRKAGLPPYGLCRIDVHARAGDPEAGGLR